MAQHFGIWYLARGYLEMSAGVDWNLTTNLLIHGQPGCLEDIVGWKNKNKNNQNTNWLSLPVTETKMLRFLYRGGITHTLAESLEVEQKVMVVMKEGLKFVGVREEDAYDRVRLRQMIHCSDSSATPEEDSGKKKQRNVTHNIVKVMWGYGGTKEQLTEWRSSKLW